MKQWSPLLVAACSLVWFRLGAHLAQAQVQSLFGGGGLISQSQWDELFAFIANIRMYSRKSNLNLQLQQFCALTTEQCYVLQLANDAAHIISIIIFVIVHFS